MSTTTRLQIGDVVEFAGLRAVVQHVSLTGHQVQVADGSNDIGVWIDAAQAVLAFRPGRDHPQQHPARVLTTARRTVGRNVGRHTLDPDAHEVIVELPGSWSITNFQQRGDNSYVVVKRS